MIALLEAARRRYRYWRWSRFLTRLQRDARERGIPFHLHKGLTIQEALGLVIKRHGLSVWAKQELRNWLKR